MGKNVDPTRAITEEEPWAIAQQTGQGISQIRHKDQFGNEITDPDRSNPTRHRMERPLETIRNFERAIYNDSERDYPRRPHRNGSTYDHQNSQRASMAYQYGDQSARQSTYDGYDNGNSYSQRQYNQNRNSAYENVASSSRQIPSDSNSGTYSNGAGSGWSGGSGDPYSTNPSSDASGYANYDQPQQQQQYGQTGRLPLSSNDKPLPNVNRYSNTSQSMNYQNGYSPQPQYQQNGYSQQTPQASYTQQPQNQQYSSYNGHSQFSPQAAQASQYRQSYGPQQPQYTTWNQQSPATKTVLTKSSAGAEGKEKRKSWFRRSKS
ncbi:hypothetical protein AA313_de0208854 [Arthrobotrys entomopaga]|nr:hypothetical protein AA313_de0208854 [Arthrobotrys entomopaga]